MKGRFSVVIGFLLCSQLLAQKQAALPIVHSIKELKLLGEYALPHNLIFKNTTVGGLSGLDYDANKRVYYSICDDRSNINPARYYTLDIVIGSKGIDTVIFKDVTSLLQPDGTTYPSTKQNAAKTPDPETLRLNPLTNEWVWTSEGERSVNLLGTLLADPAINIANDKGKTMDSFRLPPIFKMSKEEKGPRQNSVFEGIAFSNDYKDLLVSMEEPLYEDGPRADTEDVNPLVRILRFDTKHRINTAQYPYKLDPVAHAPIPLGFKVNGISDILGLSDDKLLVMERSYSVGHLSSTIKIFETDLSKATNIIDNPSLLTNKKYSVAPKKLLLNMDNLNRYIDNVEGMTFGPTLPNGNKTLLMVADNNFMVFEKTQFFLFEVIEN